MVQSSNATRLMQTQTRSGSPVEARHHRYPERGWAQLDPDAIAPGIPRTRPPTSSSMASRAADDAFRRRPPRSTRPCPDRDSYQRLRSHHRGVEDEGRGSGGADLAGRCGCMNKAATAFDAVPSRARRSAKDGCSPWRLAKLGQCHAIRNYHKPPLIITKLRSAGTVSNVWICVGAVRAWTCEDLSAPTIRRQASARLLTLSVKSGSGLPSLPSPQQDPSQGSLIPRKNLGPHSAFILIFLINIEFWSVCYPRFNKSKRGRGSREGPSFSARGFY
jgi:hypothetical protein